MFCNLCIGDDKDDDGKDGDRKDDDGKDDDGKDDNGKDDIIGSWSWGSSRGGCEFQNVIHFCI